MANKNNFDIYKYLNLFLIAIIIALIFISRQTFISSKNQESPIRIGAGDNASAIVLHYMDTEFDSFFIEPYFIHDCWAPISQWALSSNAFSMAVVCKEAAEDFMTADPDFEIVGPVVMNSDIIVETEDREVKIVGITNNKDFHIDFAKDLYGENIRIHEMKPNSLPYAYRNNQIDAMIIDINLYNEETMEGVVRHPTKGDYVSNVLIADSDFMKTQEFKDFIVEYNKTVEEINLEGLPMEYINEKTYLNERSMKYWKVKLLAIN